jgi:ABC-type branched-subunit amino acid transport system substrate-binding protein
MQIMAPVVEITQAEAAGKGMYEGIFCGMPWYWEVQDKYAAARKFVEKFSARRNRRPTSCAAAAYTLVRLVLDTARETRTLDKDKLIVALEGKRFQYLKGPEWFSRSRKSRHRGRAGRIPAPRRTRVLPRTPVRRRTPVPPRIPAP